MEQAISLIDNFRLICQNSNPSAPAFVVHGRGSPENSAWATTQAISYANTYECVEIHRQWLQKSIIDFQNKIGGRLDMVVAYISSNSIDLLLSMLACSYASVTDGGNHVAAMLNTRWTSKEKAKALASKNPHGSGTILFYGDEFKSSALEVASQINHPSICLPIPKFSSKFLLPLKVVSTRQKADMGAAKLFTVQEIASRGDQRDAMIVFTSGTTGGAKGVRLSHKAIAIQSMAKLETPCQYSTETVMLASTVPLFHIGGISSCLAVLYSGGSLVFPGSEDVRFDPESAIPTLSNPFVPCNTLVVVPAMLSSLLLRIDDSTSYPAVRLLLIGGQSAPQPMIKRINTVFPNARIVQTFACTEGASSLTFLHVNSEHCSMEQRSPNTASTKGDCVGVPPSHIDIRLHRQEDNTNKIVTLPYRPGVIATRGPHLMNGYWTRGGSTNAFPPLQGWFLTSDLGYFDERGQLYFCGRARDTIRSGGETVMAEEVERVLLRNPNVAECGVFAKQDERFGEAVACAIVPKGALGLEEIKQWCKGQGLANFKRPRYLFLVEQLPRNSSGKVLKHKLVEQFGRIRSKL